MSLTLPSWSAISRGAVVHGLTQLKIATPLKVDIKSRIARVSWGIACQEPFDRDVHHSEDMWFDPDLRMNVAVRVMKWHLVQVSRIKGPIISHSFLTFIPIK